MCPRGAAGAVGSALTRSGLRGRHRSWDMGRSSQIPPRTRLRQVRWLGLLVPPGFRSGLPSSRRAALATWVLVASGAQRVLSLSGRNLVLVATRVCALSLRLRPSHVTRAGACADGWASGEEAGPEFPQPPAWPRSGEGGAGTRKGPAPATRVLQAHFSSVSSWHPCHQPGVL